MLEGLSDRVVRFLRRATDDSIRADVIGALFILGGVLGAVSLVFPHPDAGELPIEIVTVVAIATGLLLLFTARSITAPVIHVAVAFGSVLINVMMLASGVAAGVYAGMFNWVVLVIFNFFPLRVAIAHFAWMMSCYAVVLTLVESGGGYSPVTRWIIATMALAVTGGTTAWLVYRRRLAETSAQRFLDLSQEMLCTITLDGRLSRLNRAWERTLGYPTSSLYSVSVVDLVHPEDRAETELALTRLRNGSEGISLENRFRGGDGRFHHLVWSGSFSDEEGLIYARARQRVSDPSSASREIPLQVSHRT